MNYADAAIIGAGPAGIAAAIQLKRCRINFHFFEKSRIGGLLINANRVENYPGFSKPVSGIRIVSAFAKHLDNLNISIINKEVISVEHEKYFNIRTLDEVYYSEYLIIATGTKPKPFSMFPERTSINDRFYYEIVDLLNLEGKHIVIIGAGDAAFDYALNLSGQNDITILNRGTKATCLDLLYEEALNKKRIKYFTSIHIDNISSGDNRVVITVDCRVMKYIECDYIVAAIGRQPSMQFIDPLLLDKLVKSEKVFLAGDVCGCDFRQAVIASGEGLKSAMKIVNKLKISKLGK